MVKDGYKVICEYFWGNVRPLKYEEPLLFRRALNAYAEANWRNQSDYSQIISDLTSYILQSGNGQILNNRCESIMNIASNEVIFKPQVTADFLEQLADIVFPKLDQDCLLSTFIYYHSSFKNLLFNKIMCRNCEGVKEIRKRFFTCPRISSKMFIWKIQKVKRDGKGAAVFYWV